MYGRRQAQAVRGSRRQGQCTSKRKKRVNATTTKEESWLCASFSPWPTAARCSYQSHTSMCLRAFLHVSPHSALSTISRVLCFCHDTPAVFLCENMERRATCCAQHPMPHTSLVFFMTASFIHESDLQCQPNTQITLY